jgi:hypothetical protein
VLDEVIMRKGFDPTTLNLSDSQALVMAKHIQKWVRRGWVYAFWPEWTLIEERTPNSTTHVVARALAGHYYIDAVQGVYPTEADARAGLSGFNYRLTTAGIDLSDADDLTTTVWVVYRRPSPKFTTEAYVQSKADNNDYLEGYVVYYPIAVNDCLSGECYVAALTALGAGTWEKQELPELLAEAAIEGAFAEQMLQDSNVERYREHKAAALDAIKAAYRDVFYMQRHASGRVEGGGE